MLPWRASLRSRGRILRPFPRRPSRVESSSRRSAIARCATRGANGAVNAGGRPLETPFGIISSTNITPDVETGIGAWSYPAFERAMREGIHRDGQHLYPAFPVHAFRQSKRRGPAGALRLPDGTTARARRRAEQCAAISVQRPSPDGGWNALFHQSETFQPDRENRRHGIAAHISSKALVTAPPVIRHAMRSARRKRTPISPEVSRKVGRRPR